MFKDLIVALESTAKNILHVVLVPVVAVLKAIDAFITHLITEFTKI